jgi:hypothetical protein
MIPQSVSSIRKLALLSIIILISSMLPLIANANPCIDWQKTMATLRINELPSGKIVLVEPLTNGTKLSGDNWLILGLRDYLTDLIRSGKNIRVLSGVTATHGLEGNDASFRIGGMFQRIGPKLRVFVHVMDGKSGELLKQYGVSFPYPDSIDFFIETAKVAREIMKQMDVKVDGRILKTVRDATTSVRAYEDYSKGRQALETYDPGKTRLAKTWFDQAKRADFRSPLGYQGLIDLYTFLGFYNRQMGQSSSGYYQAAQSEIIKMAKLARPAPMLMFPKKAKVTNKRHISIELDNPFMLNNISFIQGIQSEKQAMWKVAAKAFTNAVETIHVDAVSWYYLSLVEAKMGHKSKANKAMQKALSINGCIEPQAASRPVVTSPGAPVTGTTSAPVVPMRQVQTLTPAQQRGMLIVPEAAKSKAAQPMRWDNK